MLDSTDPTSDGSPEPYDVEDGPSYITGDKPFYP